MKNWIILTILLVAALCFFGFVPLSEYCIGEGGIVKSGENPEAGEIFCYQYQEQMAALCSAPAHNYTCEFDYGPHIDDEGEWTYIGTYYTFPGVVEVPSGTEGKWLYCTWFVYCSGCESWVDFGIEGWLIQ